MDLFGRFGSFSQYAKFTRLEAKLSEEPDAVGKIVNAGRFPALVMSNTINVPVQQNALNSVRVESDQSLPQERTIRYTIVIDLH
jgi:hypothetical protein